jgi:hypothetical protein
MRESLATNRDIIMKTLMRTIPVLATLALLGGVQGCSSDHVVTPPPINSTDLFWQVRLDHRAITLATGQQEQLSAVALNPVGVEITSGMSAVSYRSSDTTKVFVDATGKLTARDPATNIAIVATMTAADQNLTLADTAWVNVTATPQTIASFRIPLDSTLFAAGESSTLAAEVLDGGGNPVPGISVRYTCSNPAVLDLNALNGSIYALDTGTVKIWATTTSYGTTWTDSVTLTMTSAIWARVRVINLTYNDASSPLYLDPFDVVVRLNGDVQFLSSTPSAFGVTFDDPTATDLGDIANLNQNQNAMRKFVKLGKFTFHVAGVEKAGTVTVVP